MALLLLALGAAGAATGCHAFRSRHQPTSSAVLGRADTLYAAGDYAPAADLYREQLLRQPDGSGGDRVLFRLAVIYLSPESPVYDALTGQTYLDRLIEDHPESSLAEPARLLLELQGRIDALEQQDQVQRRRLADLSERLEALKRIDLERSREPPPR